jgi:hypothetical protein
MAETYGQTGSGFEVLQDAPVLNTPTLNNPTIVGGSGGSGTPTGAAGGVLGGTYPNPSYSGSTVTSRVITKIETPASAVAAGVAGQIVADAGFIYVCVATNTWVKAAIATW